MPGPYLNTGPFKTKISDNDLIGPVEELGVWRFEAGKILRYIKTGALIPRFEACKYDTTVTTAALMGNQVLQCDGATNIFAGVVEASLASLSFGWITVLGPATARVATGEIPGTPLGPDRTATGVLSVRNTSHFNASAVAVQSGLSFGSAVFLRA